MYIFLTYLLGLVLRLTNFNLLLFFCLLQFIFLFTCSFTFEKLFLLCFLKAQALWLLSPGRVYIDKCLRISPTLGIDGGIAGHQECA